MSKAGTDSGASTRSRSRDRAATLYRTDDGTLRMEAARSVNRWGQVEAPALEADDDWNRLPELPIPGRGDELDDCGDPLPVRFCRECGAPEWAGRTCGRSVCPRCWKAWDRDRTVTITSKLEGLRRYKEAQTGDVWTGLKHHHITLSPPDGFAIRGEDELDRAKEIVKILLNEVGADTGAIIYHPYRLDEDKKADIWDDEDDGLTWKEVIERAGDMDDIRDLLSYEPHFHAVVLSPYVIGGRMTEALERETGWVIERITKPGKNVSIGNVFDLARVTGYSLSHTGLREMPSGRTRAAYWYFGEVANFQPTQGVRDDMRNAFAAVSERILGEQFAGVAKDVEPDGDGDEAPDGDDEHRHRNVPISRATGFMQSGPWRDQATRLGELRTALNYLAAMRPRPALPPPPD